MNTDTRVSGRSLWLWALALAAAMCAGHVLMYTFRSVCQSHYPHYSERWANNGRFTVVNWFGTSVYDEVGYAARTNNASRHLPAHDPYIREYRATQQWVNDSLTYAVMGAVHRLVGDISWTWTTLLFLCCLVWFFAVHRIVLKVCGEPDFAVFCAVLVGAFSYQFILQFVHGLVWSGGLKQIVMHNLWTMLSYGRTEGIMRLPRPGVTYAFLFCATLCVVKAAETRTWKWAAFSGLLGGALAYVRVDVWTTYIVAAGLYALLISVQERRPAWTLWASVALSSALSLPFLLSCYPPSADILLRTGSTHGRQFHWDSLVYLAACAAGLKLSRKPVSQFLSCMVGATFIMLNINLITGILLLAVAWKYFGNIYVFLALLPLVPQAWRARGAVWRAAAAGLLVVALSQNVFYAAVHYPFMGLPKDYEQALRWLDSNTESDSEVMTISYEIIALVPIFTHDKTSIAYGVPDVSSYPTVPNMQRLVGALDLLGADRKRFFKECLDSDKPYSSRDLLDGGLYRGEIEKTFLGCFLFNSAPPEAQLSAREQALLHPARLQPDYIWFGHLEKEYAAKGFPPAKGPWREVYRNPSVTLYGRASAGT